jgi:hypothetical protein
MTVRSLAVASPIVLACIALSTVACQSSGVDAHASQPAATGGDKPPGAPAADKPDKKDQIEKKEHELACARLELDVARMAVGADEREAHMRVVETERKLEMAKADRDNYKNVESVLASTEAQLHLDEAKERLDEARQELTELEKTYAQEKFAEITKELVLARGKARVQLAEKGLELAQKKLAEQRDVEQPKKLAELGLALDKAQHEANEAHAREERTATEKKLKIMKAEQAIQENEHALAKLQGAGDAKEAKP